VEWYGSEKGDKAAWKSITGNTKQAIQKTLLLPNGEDPEQDDPNGKKPHRNGSTNGRKPEPPKTPPAPAGAKPFPNGTNGHAPKNPQVATAEQLEKIKADAKELGLTIEAIMTKMRFTWPPNGADAAKILKRLAEKKQEKARV
jgi:hypothetical protein